MCGTNGATGQWTGVKVPHRHSGCPRKCRRISPRRHSLHPTDAPVEWSSNTTVSFPLTDLTHNDSLSCSYQRGTAAFPKKYTESHTYREEQKNTSKEKQQPEQDTNRTQSTHNTINTGPTPIREKHLPTPAHQHIPTIKRKTDS
ncbi:uncharacterized protein TM35_000044230 [Trypanosoma theileri]|uniref:Uncharacterized protein n=1 Tax=Trypanosoma theileri TaxID=67003 RepID=A0A1X0P6K2_9TRYP|nr:uncharacterized protein TM35_000044230 [Trypanosoma theileri]ORC92209.1 hypothetical protein TM35_000044230 [Trypanosoma theileri]